MLWRETVNLRWGKIAVVAAFLIYPLQILGVGLEFEHFPASRIIDVSRYAPSEIQMKQSVIRTLIDSNWTIVEQTRHKVYATYKSAKIEVTLSGAQVELREVDSVSFKNAWLETIESYFLKDLEYHHQITIAEKLSQGK